MTDSLTPTQVFKCLADENRIRMMLLIAREEELCVCELTCALDESQAALLIAPHFSHVEGWGGDG